MLSTRLSKLNPFISTFEAVKLVAAMESKLLFEGRPDPETAASTYYLLAASVANVGSKRFIIF